MSQSVVTRFAPSPTGFLHVGGARTALFNWLYAQHTGGKMLLRIEDTDRQRSNDQATAAIFEGLRWLGIEWTGKPVFQSSRKERHQQVAEELLAKGLAYRCYCTPEEIEAMREKARAHGRPPRYEGTWRDRSPREAPVGIAGVIRIKAPREGEIAIHDCVQGEVRFPAKDLDDFIILRSDRSPTFMHAVVVDDHDMGITHIIRGDDHLTNAARQAVIYKAMGWELPVMAHIPLIHGQDGVKLSKRHGALGVEFYRAMGYLPAALQNYLARLGWSHGNDEVMSVREMIKWFDIHDINKSAARFDPQKLQALNSVHMRRMDDNILFDSLISTLPYMENGQAILDKLDGKRNPQLRTALPDLKKRAKTLAEIIDGARFLLVERPIVLDGEAEALLDDGTRMFLKSLAEVLSVTSEWTAKAIETAVREFAQKTGHKLGQVAQPLRIALTGRTTSPGIFDVLCLLGRDESLARIHDQVKRV